MAAEGGDFRGQFNYARLRAEKGDVETALAWLARVRETGTPAFMDKAEHWLRGSPIKALRDRGIAALLHGAETAAGSGKSLMWLIAEDWRACAGGSPVPGGAKGKAPLGVNTRPEDAGAGKDG